MPFTITYESAFVLKRIVDIVKDIVNLSNIEINARDGLTMQTMDTSHVALVVLSMPPESFAAFSAVAQGGDVVGVNFQSLCKILKCFDKEDRLTVSMAASGGPLVLSGPRSTFELSLLDVDVETLAIPPHDYPLVVTIAADVLQNILQQLGTIGDVLVVRFDVNAGSELLFMIEGPTGEKGTVNVPLDTCAARHRYRLNVSFALKYMNMFAKGAALCDKVRLSLDEQHPLKAEYGPLTFYLAPKIEDIV